MLFKKKKKNTVNTDSNVIEKKNASEILNI